jgi:hypothetical protein
VPVVQAVAKSILDVLDSEWFVNQI